MKNFVALLAAVLSLTAVAACSSSAGGATSAPAGTAPVTIAAIGLVVDATPGSTAEASGVQANEFGVGDVTVALLAAPQTLDQAVAAMAQNGTVVVRKQPLADGFSVAYEAVDNAHGGAKMTLLHVERTLGGKAFSCEGADTAPVAATCAAMRPAG